MESIRRILVWRLNHLHSKFRCLALSRFHVLANPDPFGRPIILLKVADLLELPEIGKDLFVPTMEILRGHLQQLNDDRLFFGETQPILQYVVILDVAGLSIRSIVSFLDSFPESLRTMCIQSVDLINWTLREIIPRFPGMLAAGTLSTPHSVTCSEHLRAVFIVNYAWTHSGIWNVVKYDQHALYP